MLIKQIFIAIKTINIRSSLFHQRFHNWIIKINYHHFFFLRIIDCKRPTMIEWVKRDNRNPILQKQVLAKVNLFYAKNKFCELSSQFFYCCSLELSFNINCTKKRRKRKSVIRYFYKKKRNHISHLSRLFDGCEAIDPYSLST